MYRDAEDTILITGQWNAGVVVPLHGEGVEAENVFTTLSGGSNRNLALVVINARENDRDEVHQTNQYWLNRFGCDGKPHNLFNYSSTLDVLVLNFAQRPRFFEEKDGVGRARKIGGDQLLSLIKTGQMVQPWIRTTDADARVGDDYWDPLPLGVAHTYPYQHLWPEGTPENVQKAIQYYEQYLRYYETGVRQAGSQYAYAAVGSLLAISAQAYESVRGFPRRQAGEDFYLLNKLAKLGPIGELDRSPVQLWYRYSERVPFGTGRSVNKISENPDDYRVYDPRTFRALKLWLEFLSNAAKDRERAKSRFLERASRDFSKVDSKRLWEIGYNDKVETALETAWNTRPEPEDRARHLHGWFDALKTLKWVHAVRDRVWQPVPIQEALT